MIKMNHPTFRLTALKQSVMQMKLPGKLALITSLLVISNNVSAHWVYISNEKDNTISVIDTESDEVIKTIEVGERPRGVTLSKDFKYLYICASDSARTIRTTS